MEFTTPHTASSSTDSAAAHATLTSASTDTDILSSLLADFSSLSKKTSLTPRESARLEAAKAGIRDADMRISSAPTPWLSLPELGGTVFVNDIPKRMPRDFPDPLEVVPSDDVTLKVAAYPFAKGGMRAAYKARVSTTSTGLTRPGSEYILKKFLKPRLRTEWHCGAQLEENNIAMILARKWNDEKPEGWVHITFIESRMVEVRSPGEEKESSEFYMMEEELPAGRWSKWLNNGGSMADSSHPGVLKFAKWTWQYTGGRFMVTDLQGAFDPATGCYTMTDPVLCCPGDLDRFGDGNFARWQAEESLAAIENALADGPGAERSGPGSGTSFPTAYGGGAPYPLPSVVAAERVERVAAGERARVAAEERARARKREEEEEEEENRRRMLMMMMMGGMGGHPMMMRGHPMMGGYGHPMMRGPFG